MGRTYRNWLASIAPPVLRGDTGARLVGLVALMFDYLAEGARQALRSSWVGDSDGPAYDALEPAGHELSLPRYPNETWRQYHGRLQSAWDVWPYAGDESVIISQLAALGYPGAVIYYTIYLGDLPASWSQFVVFYPLGTHHVGQPKEVGTFTVGDGTVIGPTGITIAEIATFRAIINKFKPGHWICPAVIFELSGWVVGTGHAVGEPDLVVGGETVYLRVN